MDRDANHTPTKEMKLEGEVIHWNRKKVTFTFNILLNLP